MRPNKYPIVNEIVMVSPTKITDLGVYVDLIEYNLEGLIILSDLCKRRFRSINRIVSIGKKFPAAVLTVDENTGNITLSKKAVTETETSKCEKDFKIFKYIYDIADLFKNKLHKEHMVDIDIVTFYKTFVWSISTDPNSILLAFRSAAKDFSKIYGIFADTVDEKWTNCFKEILSYKFKEKDTIVEAVMEIICEQQGGANIIKSALLKGQELSTDACPFRIKVVKPPFYTITVKTCRLEEVIDHINLVITVIKNLLENNAKMRIIKLPEAVIDEEFEPEKSDSEDSN